MVWFFHPTSFSKSENSGSGRAYQGSVRAKEDPGQKDKQHNLGHPESAAQFGCDRWLTTASLFPCNHIISIIFFPQGK